MHDGRLEEGSYSLGGKEVIFGNHSTAPLQAPVMFTIFFNLIYFFLRLVMDLRQIKTKTC